MSIDPTSGSSSSEPDPVAKLEEAEQSSKQIQKWLQDNRFDQFDIEEVSAQLQRIFNSPETLDPSFWEEHGLEFDKNGKVQLIDYNGGVSNDQLQAIMDKMMESSELSDDDKEELLDGLQNVMDAHE